MTGTPRERRPQLKERLFPTLSAEERERRLGLFRLLLIIQVVGTACLVALGAIDARDVLQHWVLTAGLCLAATLISIAGYLLARRRAFHVGAVMLLLSLSGLFGYLVMFYGTRGPVPLLFLWPIMVAAILQEPPVVFLTTTLATLIYGTLSLLELYQVWGLPLFRPEYFALWHQPTDQGVFVRFIGDTANLVIVYYALAFLSWLASHSLREEVRRSQEQSIELRRYRDELEERVAASTAELTQAMDGLKTSLEVIREVGNPLLPVFEGVIVAPLVGVMDSERTRLAVDRILRGTADHRAQAVILDITGVPLVDTAVAQALVRMAQGIRLLGATPILVGVRAEVAQTMVGLGVDLREIVTRATLQEGLGYALQAMDEQSLLEE